MYSRFINWLSATTFGSWIVKHIASRLDPIIFKATRGRFTSVGPPTLPQLALTVPGRRSGEPRTVQLAFIADGADYLVVASSMGSERHPAWRYNLEAADEGTVLVRGGTHRIKATVLTDEEKAEAWPTIKTTIPQMATYEQRTDRNIRVFRLTSMTARPT